MTTTRSYPSPTSAAAAALVATLALAAPACIDGTDAGEAPERREDVTSATSELWQSTPTSARPEIGQFVDHGHCTATLVAPSYVLTAAHCLVPAWVGTTPTAESIIELTDSSGIKHSFQIDGIHTFANRLDFVFWGGKSLETDVALLHLASPVPPSIAVSAAISPSLPKEGDRATIFGYGCTETGGGGYKQYYSFTFGPPTYVGCPGDSGGPVVFGGPTDNGAIFAVDSGTYNPGGDFFGWAVLFKSQIEKIIRNEDAGFERGFNRQGMDYTSFATADAGACAYYCRIDGRCRSFTWVASGGTCWLKDGVPDLVPAPGMISGLTPVLEANTNRNGMDLRNFVPPEPRAELCGAACARDTACRAWTYVAPSGNSTGMCWLKNGVPAASNCSICTSGVMDRAFEPGYNRQGRDLGPAVGASSPRLCANECAKRKECRSFTYTGSFVNNCWLKGAVPEASAAPSYWASGVRRGVEVDVNRAGWDYRVFATEGTADECQSTCASESFCQAWTYTPAPAHVDGVDDKPAQCRLKTGVPVPSPAVGYVSGVKGMEFMP